mmetsp:Transcript_9353/g.20909  ORF Transcript_9353/g.20909 Transcript_9353/m.20909 type:complete len:453 (-) Transcript_9353:93-1451(-)
MEVPIRKQPPSLSSVLRSSPQRQDGQSAESNQVSEDGEFQELKKAVQELQVDTESIHRSIALLTAKLDLQETRVVPSETSARVQRGEDLVNSLHDTLDELRRAHDATARRVDEFGDSQRELAQAVSDLDNSMQAKGEQLMLRIEEREAGRSQAGNGDSELGEGGAFAAVDELRDQINAALSELQDRMDAIADQSAGFGEEQVSQIRLLLTEAEEGTTAQMGEIRRDVASFRERMDKVEEVAEKSLVSSRQKHDTLERSQSQLDRTTQFQKQLDALANKVSYLQTQGPKPAQAPMYVGRSGAPASFDARDEIESLRLSMQDEVHSQLQGLDGELRAVVRNRADELARDIGSIRDEAHWLTMGQNELRDELEGIQGIVDRHFVNLVARGGSPADSPELLELQRQRQADARKVADLTKQLFALQSDLRRLQDPVTGGSRRMDTATVGSTSGGGVW